MVYTDIIFYGVAILWTLLMALFSPRKEFKLSKYFRLFYLFLIPVACIFIELYKPSVYMLGLYAGILLVGVCYFLPDKAKRKRSQLCIAALVLMAVNGVYNWAVPAYRNPGYTEEFREVFAYMKECYVLDEHKEIDWDSLYEEYLPQFQEADENQDASLMYETWQRFAHSFQDAHVYVSLNKGDDAAYKEYAYKCCGYDYGFALVTMEDNTTVFVNVDEDSEAYAQGIRDGMAIVAFDGEDIDSLREKSYIYFYEFPDRENEAFYSALFATANGGEEASVTYLAEDGTEQTITVHEQGSFYDRMKQTRTELLGFERTEDTNNNLSYYMVDDQTACLVINELDIEGNVRYGDGDDDEYEGLAKMMAAQLQAAKDEGAENLIIDLRGNYGGYLEVSEYMASYFTDETLFGVYEGVKTDTPGVYDVYCESDVEPGNIWGDGPIVILVNAETVSAGELFTHMMMQLDNVTVMGMTKSTGSAMAITSYASDNITICFPDTLILDQDKEVMIDAGADRIMDMPPDIIIPLDEEAFESIFEQGEDYVLDYAVQYLEQE